MTSFPTREELVAIYWRKLASSNGRQHKSGNRVGSDAALRRRGGLARRPDQLGPNAQFRSNS